MPLPSGSRNVEDCLEEFRKEEVENRCFNQGSTDSLFDPLIPGLNIKVLLLRI